MGRRFRNPYDPESPYFLVTCFFLTSIFPVFNNFAFQLGSILLGRRAHQESSRGDPDEDNPVIRDHDRIGSSGQAQREEEQQKLS